MKIPAILLSLLFCYVAVSSGIEQQKKSNWQTEKQSHVTGVETASRNVQKKRSWDVGQLKSRSNEAGLSYQEASSGTDWGGLLLDAQDTQEKGSKKERKVSPIIAWLGRLRESKLKANKQTSLRRRPYWDSFRYNDEKPTHSYQGGRIGDKSIDDDWLMFVLPASTEDYSKSSAKGESATIRSQLRNGQWTSSGTDSYWRAGSEWSNPGKKVKNEEVTVHWSSHKLPTSHWNIGMKKDNLKEMRENRGSTMDWKQARNSPWKNSEWNIKDQKINKDNSKRNEGRNSKSLQSLKNKSEITLDSSDDKRANGERERRNQLLKHKALFDSDPLVLLAKLEHGSKYKQKSSQLYDRILLGHKARDQLYESNRYLYGKRGREKLDYQPENLKHKSWREELKEASDDNIRPSWSAMQPGKIQRTNEGKHRVLIINKKKLEDKLKPHEPEALKSKIVPGEQRHRYRQHGGDKSMSSEEQQIGKDESGKPRRHMWESNIEQKNAQRNRESKEREEKNLHKVKLAGAKSRIEDWGKQEHGLRGWNMNKHLKNSNEKLSRGDRLEGRKWKAEISGENRDWKQNPRQQVLKPEGTKWWVPNTDQWNNKGLKEASLKQRKQDLQKLEREKNIMEASKKKALDEDSKEKSKDKKDIEIRSWEPEKIKKQDKDIMKHKLEEPTKEKSKTKDSVPEKPKSETSEKKKIQEQWEKKRSEEKKTKEVEIQKSEEQNWKQKDVHIRKEKPEESEKTGVKVKSDEKSSEDKGGKKVEVGHSREQEWDNKGKSHESEEKEIKSGSEENSSKEKHVKKGKVGHSEERGWNKKARSEESEESEESKKKGVKVKSDENSSEEKGGKKVGVEHSQEQEWGNKGKSHESEEKEIKSGSEQNSSEERHVKIGKVGHSEERGWNKKVSSEESEESKKKGAKVKSNENSSEEKGGKKVRVEHSQEQEWGNKGKSHESEEKEIKSGIEENSSEEKHVKKGKVGHSEERGWNKKASSEESEESKKKGVKVKSDENSSEEKGGKKVGVEHSQEQERGDKGKSHESEDKEIKSGSEENSSEEKHVKKGKVGHSEERGWNKKASSEESEESKKKGAKVKSDENSSEEKGGKKVGVEHSQEQERGDKGKSHELEDKEIKSGSEENSSEEKHVKKGKVGHSEERGWNKKASSEESEESKKKGVKVKSDENSSEEKGGKKVGVEHSQEEEWGNKGKSHESEEKEIKSGSEENSSEEKHVKKGKVGHSKEREWNKKASSEESEESKKKGVKVKSDENSSEEKGGKKVGVEHSQEQEWSNEGKSYESEEKEATVESAKKSSKEREIKKVEGVKSEEQEWKEKDLDTKKGWSQDSEKEQLKIERLDKNLKELGVKIKSSESNQSEEQRLEIGKVGLDVSKELKAGSKNVDINKSISKDSEKGILKLGDLKDGKMMRWKPKEVGAGIPKETHPGTEGLRWSPEKESLWSGNPHTREAVAKGLEEKKLSPEDSGKKKSWPWASEALNPWERGDIKRNKELQLPKSNVWREEGGANINIPAQKDNQKTTVLGKKDKKDQSLTNNKLLQNKPIKIEWADTSNERSSKSKETGSSIEKIDLKASSNLRKSDRSATKVTSKEKSSKEIAISKERSLILKNSKEEENVSKQSKNNSQMWRKLNNNDHTSDNGLIKPANVKTDALEQNMNKDETLVPDKNMGQTGSLSTIGSILTGRPISSQRSDVSSDRSVEEDSKLGDVNKAIRWRGGNIAKAHSAENVNNDGTVTGVDNQDKIEVSASQLDLSKSREATRQTMIRSAKNDQRSLKISREESKIEGSKSSSEEHKRETVAEDKSSIKRLLNTSMKEERVKEKMKKETSKTDSISNQGKTLLTASKSKGNIVQSEKVEEERRKTEKVAHEKDENYKVLEDQNRKETETNESEQVSSKKKTEETKKITHGSNEKDNWKQGAIESSVNKTGNKLDLNKKQNKDSRELKIWKQLLSGQDVSSKSESDTSSKSSETIKQDSKMNSSKKWITKDKKLQISKEKQVTKSIERNDNASKRRGASSVAINQVAKEELQVEKTTKRNVAEDHLSKQRNSKVISNLSSEERERKDKKEEVSSSSSMQDSVPELPKGDDIRVIRDGLRPEEFDTRVWKQQKDKKEVSSNESESIKVLWDTKKASREKVKSSEGNNVGEEKEQLSLASHALKPGKNEAWSSVLGVRSLEKNDKSSWNKETVRGNSRKTKWNVNEMARSNLRISAEKQLIEDNKQEVPSIISSPAALNTKTTGKARPPVANEDSIIRHSNEVPGAKRTNEFESPRTEETIRKGKLENWTPIPPKQQQSGKTSDKIDIGIKEEETTESSKSEHIIKDDKVINWLSVPLTKQPSVNWNNKEDIELQKQETKESSSSEEKIRNDQVKQWPPKSLKKQPSVNWNNKEDTEKQKTKESSSSEEKIRNDKVKKWSPKPLEKQPSVNWNNKEDIELGKQNTKESSSSEEIIKNDQVKKWSPKPLEKQPSVNWNNKEDIELGKQNTKESSSSEEIIKNDEDKKWGPKPPAKPVSVKETSILNVPIAQNSGKQISKEEDQKSGSSELSDEHWNTEKVEKLHPASRNLAKPPKGVNKNESPESWESHESGSHKSSENESWIEILRRMFRSILWITRYWRSEKSVLIESDTKTSHETKETSKVSDADNLDVYLVKWGQKGPVKIAAVSNKQPSVVHKLLLPRKSYAEIRESYKNNAIKNIPVVV